MGLLLVIIIGGIVGWLAAMIGGRDTGVIGSILLGMVGSLVGRLVAGLLGISAAGLTSLTLAGAVWSFIGALILVVIINAIQGSGRARI